MFDTREEALMRLDGTVIQGPRGPVYVRTVESNSRFTYREFSKIGGLIGTTKTGDLESGEFSVKPFPLGYMNRGDACYYMQRMPIRKYKQGLHTDAVRLVMNGTSKKGIRDRGSYLYEGIGFLNMYNNNYPTVKEVVWALGTGDFQSQAFHREWSLGCLDLKTFALYYKGNEVGVYIRETGEFELNARRRYLQEALMEARI